jgi:hypothetical protein
MTSTEMNEAVTKPAADREQLTGVRRHLWCDTVTGAMACRLQLPRDSRTTVISPSSQTQPSVDIHAPDVRVTRGSAMQSVHSS